MPKNTPSILDANTFTTVLAKATRKAGFQVERSEGFILDIVHLGKSVRCNLTTAYDAYRRAPDRLDDIVAAHLSALAALPGMPTLPTAAEFHAGLLPLLNQRGRLASLQRPDLPAPLHRSFPGGLVVTYVVDHPKTMAYVNPRLFETIGVANYTEEELHALALNNLRKRTRPKGYDVHGLGDRVLIIVKELDGYTACRVLLPELLDEWARKAPGRLLVGIPNRDFLIGFGDKDPQHVAAIMCQLRTDAAKMPHPLTSSVLLWQEGQLRTYQRLH